MSHARKPVAASLQNVVVTETQKHKKFVGDILAAVLLSYPPGYPVPDSVVFMVTKAAWPVEHVVVVPIK